MAGRGKAKMKTYEARDRAGDKRMGIKEGTSRDTRMDSKAPPRPPGPPKAGGRKAKR
jgi:hypothetical protein